MNQFNLFTSIKEIVNIHSEQLIQISKKNKDHDLESIFMLYPNCDTSTKLREIAYDISERVLDILNEAGIYYRVLPQEDKKRDYLRILQNAKTNADLIDSILWIFSPVNGKELPERVLDGSMLLLIQKIEEYLLTHNNLKDSELFSNAYQVHINYLKNTISADSKIEYALAMLQELVSKQKAGTLEIRNDYMVCPECEVKLGFNNHVCPNYCFNCGKRLKRNN